MVEKFRMLLKEGVAMPFHWSEALSKRPDMTERYMTEQEIKDAVNPGEVKQKIKLRRGRPPKKLNQHFRTWKLSEEDRLKISLHRKKWWAEHPNYRQVRTNNFLNDTPIVCQIRRKINDTG
jgi:hypothetical protein